MLEGSQACIPFTFFPGEVATPGRAMDTLHKVPPEVPYLSVNKTLWEGEEEMKEGRLQKEAGTVLKKRINVLNKDKRGEHQKEG